ncbi:MAG: carboxypeptidase regulatory-like domain-containing protein [Elusimicrobia bacterium]|nr:carboxypeptidase regulatory-like domain-containing protein [Elusimicrobiota bacterium]
MRSLARLIIAAALSASALIASAATTTLNVHIKDQNGAALQNVNVAAIEFGMNGPSTYTQVGVTNASGDALFTIEQQKSYNLLYSLQGYSPTISDQFNNPEYDPNRYVWAMNSDPVYSTFTMTSGLTGVGKLMQAFLHATPNKVLFGGVYNMLSQQPGGSGIVITDGAGAGTLEVENVPYADPNTYNIGLYDPEKNKGIGRNVMSALDDTSPLVGGVHAVSYTGGATLDFDQSMPPARVDNNTGGGGSASGASVEGILVSTNSEPIPYMGIGVKACVGYEWNTWANADENGRFKLYGLTPGVTYYLQVMGGCTWSQSGPGNCYEPYVSAQYSAQDICTADNSTVTPNDIVYVSSDVLYHPVALNQMPPSIGQIKVCVKSSAGYPIPNSNVNLNPDGSPWSRVNCVSHNWGTPPDDIYSPGFSNANMNTGADGCATFDSLPSGNYMINAWTPFSSGMTSPYNAGPDGTFTNSGMNGGGGDWQQAHCTGTGVDDYRVTVDTTQAQTMYVYDSSGTVVKDLANVALSSITYIVSTGNNTGGEVKGRITFPRVVDLTNNPVVITLYGQCNNVSVSTFGPPSDPCPSGNMALINGSGADHYDYTVNVSSGYAYYMNVGSSNWGRVRRGGGNDTIHLEGSTSVVVNMEFQPAGTVTGTVYKPDGTVLTPSNNLWVGVNVGSDNGWSYTQLQKDGTFSMNNILPGVNRVSINVSGGGPNGVTNFNYSLPSPQPTVTVVAGNTSTINLNLVKANYVGVQLNTAKVPDATIVSRGYDNVLGFKVVPLPAGTVMKGNTIGSMLFAKGEDNSQFRYSNPTGAGQSGPCGDNWPGGFCAASLPSPAVYDLYLMRSGDFGDMSSTTPVVSPPYPHFTLLTSSKNVVVDDAHANALVRPAFTMGQSSGVVVNLTPSTDMSGRGNATLKGSVAANHFFRQADYDALGGDFDKFLEYLPVVALYDSNGAFSAAGVVVPPPSFIAQHDQDFNIAFGQGFQALQTLLASAGSFGFEIRGLAPSACYTAVVTTPNYPPYQTRTCVGADKSTTTISVDLDAAVGSGATVQGVVTSTNSAVRLVNASVQLSGDGIDARSAVTDSTGAYKFEGLPEGAVNVKVTMDGFAPASVDETLVGANVYTKNFALTAAGGSITGTVYSQKLPFAKVQAGAQIVAYDDTYNGLHPTEPLALLKTMTGSDGSYKISGLVPGDVYKVFLKVTGKYTLSVATTAVDGTLAGVDFTMLAKPLDIELFARKGDQFYEFTVLNPKDFKSGVATWSVAPYDPATASTMTLTQLSSGELSGKIPLSSLAPGTVYVLQGVAQSYSGKQVVRELLFGKGYKGNTRQNIDDIILGDDSEDDKGRKNNEAAMDNSGDDPSALAFPPGAVLPVSTGAIPTCTFKGQGKDDAAVADKVAALGADAFAGNLYTVSMDSVTSNDNKSIELTLAYDKTTASLTDLTVARYNDGTGSWDQVPGVATVNPLKGTVKVKLKNLASVLARPGSVQTNSFDGRQYSVRPRASAASSSTSGTFAVIRPSVVTGGGYSGSKLKVFNYPNPFNLKDKAISNNQGATLPGTTNGTVIHVEVPAGNGGAGHVRIYTLAGELVKDISAVFTAGTHNYVLWDGHNSGGQEVANGVYYGVVELSGKKPSLKDATFKMAVVK